MPGKRRPRRGSPGPDTWLRISQNCRISQRAAVHVVSRCAHEEKNSTTEQHYEQPAPVPNMKEEKLFLPLPLPADTLEIETPLTLPIPLDLDRSPIFLTVSLGGPLYDSTATTATSGACFYADSSTPGSPRGEQYSGD
ncbi:unnamed protein product [Amoebophrya sp. A120]|nr:unnamed protein product [Amoebophrya sp. A120]|eukprot:GSA120T00001499001.1